MMAHCELVLNTKRTQKAWNFLTDVFHALKRLTFHYINHAGTVIHIQAVLDCLQLTTERRLAESCRDWIHIFSSAGGRIFNSQTL